MSLSQWPVDRHAAGVEVFGGRPDTMQQSTDVIVNECRDRGWIEENDDGKLRLTEEGLKFIGRA